MQYEDIAVSFWSVQPCRSPHVLFTALLAHLSLSSFQMPVFPATLSALPFRRMPNALFLFKQQLREAILDHQSWFANDSYVSAFPNGGKTTLNGQMHHCSLEKADFRECQHNSMCTTHSGVVLKLVEKSFLSDNRQQSLKQVWYPYVLLRNESHHAVFLLLLPLALYCPNHCGRKPHSPT